MTAQLTQYRPICEVKKDMPVDVRAAWELAASVNNYQRYVANHKVIDHLYLPALQSYKVSGTPGTDDPSLLMQCPLHWLGAYNYVRWWACGKMTTGTAAGGDYTQFTIWLSTRLLTDATLDTRGVTLLGQTTFDVTSENRTWYTGTFAVTSWDAYRMLYCTLGSVDADVDVVAQSSIYALQLQPIVVS